MEKAQSTLGYLKIVTPRRVSDGQAGVTRTVFGSTDPSAVNPRKAYSNWTGNEAYFRRTVSFDDESGNNLDPDSVSRHYHGLRRMGFRDNAHAKGIF